MSDLISRQAAIDAMANTLWHYPNECYRNLNEYEFAKGLAELGLKSVPPAQSERKRGKWLDEGFYADGHGAHAFRCSECGGHIIEYDTDPFCKWCGADMREEVRNDLFEY